MLAKFGTFSVSNNFGAWTVPDGVCRVDSRRPEARHRTAAARASAHFVLSIRRPVRRSFSEGGSREAAKADRVAGATADRIVVLHVTPLMSAIVDHVCATPSRDAAASKHLLAVVLDQLPQQRELPLFVPAPRSPLALRVAEALASDPADTPRTSDLAAELGVSARTLERAFTADASMPLGEWRQRARICRAIALLAAGGTVRDIALEVGYATPSAFIATFKKYVGLTPHRLTSRSSSLPGGPSVPPSRSAPPRAARAGRDRRRA